MCLKSEHNGKLRNGFFYPWHNHISVLYFSFTGNKQTSRQSMWETLSLSRLSCVSSFCCCWSLVNVWLALVTSSSGLILYVMPAQHKHGVAAHMLKHKGKTVLVKAILIIIFHKSLIKCVPFRLKLSKQPWHNNSQWKNKPLPSRPDWKLSQAGRWSVTRGTETHPDISNSNR